jgi:hypothetical protein
MQTRSIASSKFLILALILPITTLLASCSVSVIAIAPAKILVDREVEDMPSIYGVSNHWAYSATRVEREDSLRIGFYDIDSLTLQHEITRHLDPDMENYVDPQWPHGIVPFESGNTVILTTMGKRGIPVDMRSASLGADLKPATKPPYIDGPLKSDLLRISPDSSKLLYFNYQTSHTFDDEHHKTAQVSATVLDRQMQELGSGTLTFKVLKEKWTPGVDTNRFDDLWNRYWRFVGVDNQGNFYHIVPSGSDSIGVVRYDLQRRQQQYLSVKIPVDKEGYENPMGPSSWTFDDNGKVIVAFPRLIDEEEADAFCVVSFDFDHHRSRLLTMHAPKESELNALINDDVLERFKILNVVSVSQPPMIVLVTEQDKGVGARSYYGYRDGFTVPGTLYSENGQMRRTADQRVGDGWSTSKAAAIQRSGNTLVMAFDTSGKLLLQQSILKDQGSGSPSEIGMTLRKQADRLRMIYLDRNENGLFGADLLYSNAELTTPRKILTFGSGVTYNAKTMHFINDDTFWIQTYQSVGIRGITPRAIKVQM